MKTKTASRSAKKAARPPVSRAGKGAKPKASAVKKKSTASAKPKSASAAATKYQQSGAPWWKAFL